MATMPATPAAPSAALAKKPIPWGTIALVGGFAVGGIVLYRAYKKKQAAGLSAAAAPPKKKVTVPTVALPKPSKLPGGVTTSPGAEPVRPPGAYGPSPSSSTPGGGVDDYNAGAQVGRADGLVANATLSVDPWVSPSDLMVHYDTDQSDAWKKGYKTAFNNAIG
jgi:hypothetical protein